MSRDSSEPENVINRFPQGWITGYEHYQDDGDIIEYVPQGETVENWTEIMTFQTFKNAANADTEDYLGTIANLAKSACTKSNFFLKDVKKKENGFETSRALLACAKNLKTGKDETTMFKVISGHQALYVAQIAKRSDPAVPADRPDDAEFQKWETLLDSFKVCHGLKC